MVFQWLELGRLHRLRLLEHQHTWLVNGYSTKFELVQSFFDTQLWLVIEDQVVDVVLVWTHAHDVIGFLLDAVAFRCWQGFKNSSEKKFLLKEVIYYSGDLYTNHMNTELFEVWNGLVFKYSRDPKSDHSKSDRHLKSGRSDPHCSRFMC